MVFHQNGKCYVQHLQNLILKITVILSILVLNCDGPLSYAQSIHTIVL